MDSVGAGRGGFLTSTPIFRSLELAEDEDDVDEAIHHDGGSSELARTVSEESAGGEIVWGE